MASLIRVSLNITHNYKTPPKEGGERRKRATDRRTEGDARCRVVLCDKMKRSGKFPTHVGGENEDSG